MSGFLGSTLHLNFANSSVCLLWLNLLCRRFAVRHFLSEENYVKISLFVTIVSHISMECSYVTYLDNVVSTPGDLLSQSPP